ncbi:hypothetical protein PHLCEN_2v4543 [Hermanssonia centrifuga]|uniref:DNA-(apurinic or apyrimidinic site) lyase n=1 Tax=Hermanssonia centrifuga TaxID=98765 RepID=A0A2R6PND1_9APHY|nr:hypothetical protein PHLCEN_2v4543 [Hermanssonia centrifuga]
MVKALCQQFSPPLLKLPPPHVQSDDECITTTYHAFPRPSVLAAPEVSNVLRSLGFGYRAAFIQRTAKMLVDAQGISTLSTVSLEPAELWLRTLRKMNTAEARVELLKFVGVGRKVADCVLLMSLDKTEVVPVDTHVHQIASKHYGLPSSKAKVNMTPALYEQVNAKLTEVWGTYAGWAHSVLFTSDLKAFSTYGLHSDASSTILPSPSPSPTKRKRKEDRPTKDTTSATLSKVSTLLLREDLPEAGLSLADRVKRRRRGQDTSSSIT